MRNLIKNNIRALILIIILIVLGIISATLALRLNFAPIGINADVGNVIVNVRYEKDGDNDISSITSTGDLTPITLDTSSINNVLNSSNVVKFKFWVSGDASNPNNSIYDIALNNINIDCELKSPYVKWLLYKNNTLLSSGNFSPTFDAMPNNRMVLTSTQENLTTTEDEYLLAIYIEEACSDINNCQNVVDQSSLVGRRLLANIGIETSTKAKKTNVRTTSTDEACVVDDNNASVNLLECVDNLVYDGTEQSLIKGGTVPTGVTVNQAAGTTAGEYNVTVKLNHGYKWSNDTYGDYTLNCIINKRSITISTQDQCSDSFTSAPAKVNVTNLVSGHTINSIHLNTISAEGGNVITAGHAIIYDSNSNDVTNNYVINYQSTGKITACQ